MPDLFPIIALSLSVSLTATLLGFAVGMPLALWVLLKKNRFQSVILSVGNALLALPSVVVGLLIYILLSNNGFLGGLNLLFTPTAMVLAQFFLTLPIVFILTHRLILPLYNDFNDALTMDGASNKTKAIELLNMARGAITTIFLTAFGRAIAEVGAIMLVGGNIRDHTRTMTTTIALETSKGDFPLALTLGAILMAISLLISSLATYFSQDKL
jgi:tungstate transport system permease protein